jgi:hypothetical protein
MSSVLSFSVCKLCSMKLHNKRGLIKLFMYITNFAGRLRSLGRSVGIVRLRTKATEFIFLLLPSKGVVMFL